MKSHLFHRVVVCFAVLFFHQAAIQAQVTFTNQNDQDYTNAANWSSATVPDATTHAQIAVNNQTVIAKLDDSSSQSVFRFEIGVGQNSDGKLILDAGSTLTATNLNGAFLPDFQNTNYIGSFEGTGTLDILNGSEFVGHELRLGYFMGANGSVNVSNESKLTLEHILLVGIGLDSTGTIIFDDSELDGENVDCRIAFGWNGNNPTGRMELLNGSTAKLKRIEGGVGFNVSSGCQGTLIVDASDLDVGDILAGSDKTTNRFDMNFRNGAVVDTGNIFLGGTGRNTLEHFGGIGTMQILGATTTLDIDGNLAICLDGESGSVTQTNAQTTITGSLLVGRGAVARGVPGIGNGTYTLSGATAELTVGGQVVVGETTTGELTISSGAELTSGPFGFIVGSKDGGDGKVTIGAGSTLNVPSGHLWVGEQSGSTGVVEQAGGEVYVADRIRLGLFEGSDGDYQLNGGVLRAKTIEQLHGDFTWGGGKLTPTIGTLFYSGAHESAANAVYAIEQPGQEFNFLDGIDISNGGSIEVYEITPNTSSGITTGKITLMQGSDITGITTGSNVPFQQLNIVTATDAQLISYDEAQARSNWSPFIDNRYWIQFIDDPSGDDKLILHYSFAPDNIPTTPLLDINQDGYSDSWAILYPGAAQLDPNLDEDNDGFSNYDESLHGTDPFSITTQTGFSNFSIVEPGTFKFEIFTSPYFHYQIFSSSTLDAEFSTWTDTGIVVTSEPNSSLIEATLTETTEDKKYFRTLPIPIDSDGDSLSDYDELALGYDPFAQVTYSSGLTDFADAQARLSSPLEFSIAATRDYSVEGDSEGLVFEVTRSGSLEAATLNYSFSGTATANADFSPGTQSVSFAFGDRMQTITIVPTSDGQAELAEQLIITLQPSTNYLLGNATAQGIIDDLPVANSRASLRNIGTPLSAGYGLATLAVAGNGLSIDISTEIYNTTSPETGAAILLPDSNSDLVTVLNLTVEQLENGYHWIVSDTAGFTATEIVAAINNGEAQMEIYTENYPTGEIRGTISVTDQVDSTPNPEAPPTLDLSSPTVAEIIRFTEQSSFGATPDLIADIQSLGFEGWIDQQLTIDTSNFTQDHLDLVTADDPGTDGYIHYRNASFWKTTLTGDDQLRLRTAWALSQIFVVSANGTDTSGMHYGLAHYNDLLAENAFGNFRDLLEQVTLSPAMALYLSMFYNQKPDLENEVFPDENYAREVMQLFTIGLDMLHLDGTPIIDSAGNAIPTYTPTDVQELARTLTGWTYAPVPADYQTPSNPRLDLYFWANRIDPIVGVDALHDLGEKTIIGGTVIPAGGTTLGDMGLALDALFNHPNVGPFICKQLIQRLVTSNPSPGYVHRVASVFNDNGSGVRGDMGAVVKAILLDFEARSSEVSELLTFGHLKEPVVKYAQFMRRFGIDTTDASNFGYSIFRDSNMQIFLGDAEQFPYRSPSVFNFYRPDYDHPGELRDNNVLSPEFQILNAKSSARTANLYYYTIMRGNPSVDLSELIPLASTPDQLVDFLNEQLLANKMSQAQRDDLVIFLGSLTETGSDGSTRTTNQLHEDRARMALHLFALSPEFAVSR